MSDQSPLILEVNQLKAICRSSPNGCNCALKHCQGWESMSDDRWPAGHLQRHGTLRRSMLEGQNEPSFEEFHPNGTRYDSPQAPIAPAYFPYNRCDVFACTKCGCGVLRYTEYGGYYIDNRVRLMDPDLIINPDC